MQANPRQVPIVSQVEAAKMIVDFLAGYGGKGKDAILKASGMTDEEIEKRRQENVKRISQVK
jgi:hypothetical protein